MIWLLPITRPAWYQVCLLALLSAMIAPSIQANPKSLVSLRGNVVSGPSSEVEGLVNGFYADKMGAYYSYVYITVADGKYKGIFEYKEAGETNRGYMHGDYHAEQGWGEGIVCYENNKEWLAKGGIVFTKTGNTIALRLLYTETIRPEDDQWKDDWTHIKVGKHKNLDIYKNRYESSSISCGTE